METVNNPLRLKYRLEISQMIRSIVTQPESEPLEIIKSVVNTEVSEEDRSRVEVLVTEELGRIHEGVLLRYRLSLSDLDRWKSKASGSIV